MQNLPRWMSLGTAALISSLVLAAPDFTQYGYPNVAASLTLNPYDYVRLGLGSAVLTIPEEAFGSSPVRLELLRGDSAVWQAQAPAGQKVLYAFALRVTDLKTEKPITKFSQPITFSFYSNQITSGAGLWDTQGGSPVVINPDPVRPSIRLYKIGQKFPTGILSHRISSAEFGWLITVPGA